MQASAKNALESANFQKTILTFALPGYSFYKEYAPFW